MHLDSHYRLLLLIIFILLINFDDTTYVRDDITKPFIDIDYRSPEACSGWKMTLAGDDSLNAKDGGLARGRKKEQGEREVCRQKDQAWRRLANEDGGIALGSAILRRRNWWEGQKFSGRLYISRRSIRRPAIGKKKEREKARRRNKKKRKKALEGKGGWYPKSRGL